MVCAGIRNSLEPLALTLLRVYTGVVMAVHGWEKIQNYEATVKAFTGMGIPNPEMAVYLAIGGEFLGGLGLIFGLLTPIAAFGVFCTMAVAVFKVHWANGLLAKNGGFEFPGTLMMVALFFIIRGAGPISLDGLFGKKSSPPETP